MVHGLTNEENCHTKSVKSSRVYFLVKPDFRNLGRCAATAAAVYPAAARDSDAIADDSPTINLQGALYRRVR
jgi:hypothetical protein